MNTLLLYLVESTLSVSVLYAIYWFFLRRDTFFVVNRFYLLAMVLFSMLVPLLPHSWTPSYPSAFFMVLLEPVLITPSKMELTLQEHLQWIEVAATVYLTGVFVFMLRFGLQMIQLHRITRRFGIRERYGRRVVFVDRGYSPFSFFNLVFINEVTLPANSLQTILEHEQVHISQHHTVDLILVELATILQWFNPIIWLTGREMKSIHEYLADEGVLQNGISRSIYQQMILDETLGFQLNNLTNNFNVSLLKKRIAMMTKSKSKTWAKSKVLIALPALLILGFLLTSRSYSSAVEVNAAANRVYTQADVSPVPEPVLQDNTKKEPQVKSEPVKTGKEVYKKVDKMPSYTGGDQARIKFLMENITYPQIAVQKKIQGKVFVTFIVRSDGSITDVKILSGIGGGCDEEALRVVKMMPKWIPGEHKGKPVDVYFTLPIKFALS